MTKSPEASHDERAVAMKKGSGQANTLNIAANTNAFVILGRSWPKAVAETLGSMP